MAIYVESPMKLAIFEVQQRGKLAESYLWSHSKLLVQ
jgi:hypothetical protein